MHLRRIAETATLLTWTEMERSDSCAGDRFLAFTEYWKETCFLFRYWNNSGHKLRYDSSSEQISLLLEEILTAELLTRSISAKIFSDSSESLNAEIEQVAQKSIDEHAKIRDRVFALLQSIPTDSSRLLKCEKLFRKVQRWTDLLVSYGLDESESPLKAAFHPERSLEFYDDRSSPGCRGSSFVSRQLEIAALVRSFPNRGLVDSPGSQAHQVRCAQALLFCGKHAMGNSGLSGRQRRRRILVSEGFSSNASQGFEADSTS